VAFVGIGIGIITFFGEGIIQSSQAKVEDISEGEGTRALIYAELIANMVNEPLGMGKGRFVETNTFSWTGKPVYPHQNFLGIGAELGVPALVLFAGFVLTASFVLMRRAWTPSQYIPRALKMVAAVALAMFVYQQFRGLFQDTWTFRETYFWLGLAMGATSIERKVPAAGNALVASR
jgi:O-antigen ligase